MSMSSWAENEIKLACKRENPNWDGTTWDYGCACYQSALKAYKSIMEDEHSGCSFGFTKNILIRLMNGLPLSSIRDEDFFPEDSSEVVHESEEYLKEHGLKSSIQCPRKSSLFRDETLDGKISYYDLDRYYCVDVESPSNTFCSGDARIVDELFPITMPYRPDGKQYKVYVKTFLTDENNGDFDTRAVLYVETPDGEKIEVNRYYKEDEGHRWVETTKEDFEARERMRLDKPANKAARNFLWTLLSNSSSEEESDKRDEWFKSLAKEESDKIFDEMIELCQPFEKSDNYNANTFDVEQSLCNPDNDCAEYFAEYPFLKPIKEYLMAVLEKYTYYM